MIHQELIWTFGDDAYGMFEIEIRLQKFRNRDSFDQDFPIRETPPLMLSRDLRHFWKNVFLSVLVQLRAIFYGLSIR
jgi:hypothetical protein